MGPRVSRRRWHSAGLAAFLAAPGIAIGIPAPGSAATPSPVVAHVAGKRVTSGPARSLGQLPAALAATAGSLVIQDAANNQIRLVDLASGNEKVLYGDGQATYDGPAPTSGGDGRKVSLYAGLVAATADGTTYIWDSPHSKIVTIDSHGSMTVRAAPQVPCSGACSAMAARNGSLYVAGGRYDPRVYRIDSDNTVTVIAGTGQAGHSGDGGPATGARLEDPVDLAVDEAGDVFVADSGGRYIRKISNGNMSSVAGTGTLGDSGDGGAATAADIDAAHVDVTPLGTVFFTSSMDDVVREISATGTITRYAGIPNAGPARPLPFPSSWDDGQPALETGFLRIGDLAVAPDGTVFVAQLENDSGVVRRIAPAGNHTVRTVAGNGTSGYGSRLVSPPQFGATTQLAIARNGRILVAGAADRVVRRVDPTTGSIEALIGSGACCAWTSANPHGDVVGEPYGVAVAGDGTVYVADGDPIDRIGALDPGGRWSVVAGYSGFPHPPGKVIPALIHPWRIAVDAFGRIYVADHCAIDRIDGDRIRTIAGTPDQCDISGWGGPARSAHIGFVYGLTVDPHGRVLFSSLGGPDAHVGRIGASGRLEQQCLCFGSSIAVDAAGTILLDGITRLDTASHSAVPLSNRPLNEQFPPDSGDGGPLADSTWYTARASAIAPDGTVYVDDGGVIRSITGLAAAAVAPSPPRSLRARLSANGTLRVHWAPPRYTGGDLPHAYRVVVMPGHRHRTVDGDTFRAVMTGLNPGSTYTVSVRARNAAGLSKASSSRTG